VLLQDRTVVDVPVSKALTTAAYTVDWQVTANDGDTRAATASASDQPCPAS
jgi:methionine-rich copper-binding protein CopC